MLILDAILLFLASILSAGLAFVVRPRRRELEIWAGSYAALFMGTLLFSFRGAIPDFLSVVMANFLILSFFAGIVIGIDFFRGRKPRFALAVAASALAFAFFLWFGVIRPALAFRFVFYSLFVASASVTGAVAIARGIDKPLAAVSRIAAFLLACIALVSLSRIVFAYGDGLPDDIMEAPLWEGVVQATSGTLVTILCFTLLLLHERRENEELAKALGERELLVREMAHRTKNDLALVDSLISLERDALVEGGCEAADEVPVSSKFDSLRDRIRCLANAHDKLSLSADPGAIKLDEYLEVVASALPTKPGVEVVRDFDPLVTSFGLAAPLGLAMNELATNALKHAFPGGRGGSVKLSLRTKESPEGGLRAVLVVRDDGTGVSWPLEHPGLGSMIVESFARKLGGRLDYAFEGGSVFSLDFTIPPDQLRGPERSPVAGP